MLVHVELLWHMSTLKPCVQQYPWGSYGGGDWPVVTVWSCLGGFACLVTWSRWWAGEKCLNDLEDICVFLSEACKRINDIFVGNGQISTVSLLWKEALTRLSREVTI